MWHGQDTSSILLAGNQGTSYSFGDSGELIHSLISGTIPDKNLCIKKKKAF